MINQGGRTGYWTTYNNVADPQTQTPAKPAMVNQFPVEPAGVCMMSAFHSSATGQAHYVGFGAKFKPRAPVGSDAADAYDVSQWDGITFRAKTGGAPTAQPVYVEILTKDTEPVASGGTATNGLIDLRNNRGVIANVVSTTYQQFFVPFAALIPRSLPSPGPAGCPAPGANVPKCQAPAFNPLNALGIQFSWYGPLDTPGFPNPSPVGSYNIFVDDVAFYKRSALPAGMSDLPAFAQQRGRSPASRVRNHQCALHQGCGLERPTSGAGLRQLEETFRPGGRGRISNQHARCERCSDRFGSYRLRHVDLRLHGRQGALRWPVDLLESPFRNERWSLMIWRIPGSATDGTATDSDEDAAFAMLMASKQWTGGTYAADATKLIQAVLAHDMSGSFIMGGSNYTAALPTNPSYFAPAYYRAFAKADPGNAATWTGLANGAYTLLSNISPTSNNGLYAAWCGSNCTQIVMNSGSMNSATDVLYQYDSHRLPWRIGTDYCWNGTAAAKAYVDKTSAFFSSASRGGGGVGRILDIYNPNGTDVTGSASNSASIVGTAASGAMANATYAPFVNDAYQMVLDLLNRGDINDRAAAAGTKSAYSYFNSTVGMLTLLTMSGNFQDWTQ